MRTAPQPQAARTAQNGAQLYAALELTPAEQAGKHRGRVKPFGRHRGRRGIQDADAEKAANEFHAMGEDKPVPAPDVRRTAPQPSFTPNGRGTGPQRIPRFMTETERILDLARRRADAVPVPPPPAAHPVTAAQAWQSLHRLRYPSPDSRDRYGNTPAYVAMMHVADILTGTTSRYGYAAAHPLPVAPEVPRRGTAITREAVMQEWPMQAESAGTEDVVPWRKDPGIPGDPVADADTETLTRVLDGLNGLPS